MITSFSYFLNFDEVSRPILLNTFCRVKIKWNESNSQYIIMVKKNCKSKIKLIKMLI